MRLPSQEFYEIALHLSAMFQPYFVERRTLPWAWRRMIWPLLHDSRLKDAHLILQPVNRLSDNGLRVELKDEGTF